MASSRFRLIVPHDPRGVGEEPDYRFTLANERTFLAWIRTALALAAGGLAVISLLPDLTGSEVLGVLLLALSFATAATAYRRWALANPVRYLVMFGRAVPDFEPSAAARERAEASLAGLGAAVAANGAPDPVDGAYHLYATVHGYVMLELIGLGPPEADVVEARYDAGLRRALAAIGL